MRGRGGQVLGVGGRHERTGPVARAAAVALAVLRGTTRVRGQITGRGTSQRVGAAGRLVRPPRRATTTAAAAATAAAVAVRAPLPIGHVAAPATATTTGTAAAAAAAGRAAEPQQQQL